MRLPPRNSCKMIFSAARQFYSLLFTRSRARITLYSTKFSSKYMQLQNAYATKKFPIWYWVLAKFRYSYKQSAYTLFRVRAVHKEESCYISFREENRLKHVCQTQAQGPNLARNVIMFGLWDHSKCALELACGLYHIFYFKLNLIYVFLISRFEIWFFQILCLIKIEAYFQLKRLKLHISCS